VSEAPRSSMPPNSTWRRGGYSSSAGQALAAAVRRDDMNSS